MTLCAHAGDAVLQEMNLARGNPEQYAAIVEARMQSVPGADARSVSEAASFLRRQQPLPPLQPAAGLMASAHEQVLEQGPRGAIGHRGLGGSSPWARMSRQGQWLGRAGENISYGYPSARAIVVTLIVDQGVPDRGHRRNIFSRDFTVAGASCGPHARYGSMCVIDFAGGFVSKGDTVAMASTSPWRSRPVFE